MIYQVSVTVQGAICFLVSNVESVENKANDISNNLDIVCHTLSIAEYQITKIETQEYEVGEIAIYELDNNNYYKALVTISALVFFSADEEELAKDKANDISNNLEITLSDRAPNEYKLIDTDTIERQVTEVKLVEKSSIENTKPLDSEIKIGQTDGLSKREYFAAIALQGLLANSTVNLNARVNSRTAIEYADELIKGLNQS